MSVLKLEELQRKRNTVKVRLARHERLNLIHAHIKVCNTCRERYESELRGVQEVHDVFKETLQ